MRTPSTVFLATVFWVLLTGICDAANNPCAAKDARYRDISCALDAFSKAEKMLNAAYQNLLDAQEEESEKKLRSGQRAWIIFRDTDAKFVAAHAPDQAKEQLLFVNQQLDTTMARIQQLKKQMPRQKPRQR